MNKRNAKFMIAENKSRYAEYQSFRKKWSGRNSFQKVSSCSTVINWYYKKKENCSTDRR